MPVQIAEAVDGHAGRMADEAAVQGEVDTIVIWCEFKKCGNISEIRSKSIE